VKHAMSRLLAGFAVLALCVVFAGTAEAQTGKLTGIVTDAQSGAPLEGAQVILEGTGISALTGSNGRFFIVNVPPGTYAVLVRRIGYTSARFTNVLVQIDVTRAIDADLAPTGAVGVEEIVVTAEEVPLIAPGVTGSGSNLRAEEIAALPVTNIAGVLSLQQGFLQVPQNTDIVSFTDSRRNPATPVRIRGGRGGETLSLIDGFPINNFVFGGPAFDITREAVEQIDFQRGGFEPQYGNALSGIINIATREGGTSLAGAVSWTTSSVGGALGSRPDELRQYDQLEGYVSGPIPGTANKARFMVSGRTQDGKDGVFEFDDDVLDFDALQNTAATNDLNTGWRAFGYDHQYDLLGKLTYYLQPTLKVSVNAITYRRQRLPYDFDYLLTYGDPLASEAITSLTDTLRVGTGAGNTGNRVYRDVVQGSIWVKRDFVSGKWDHVLGRWSYTVGASYFDQQRETCNFFQGVCLGDRFADINFNGRFVAPGISLGPTQGTDEFFGGERLKTVAGRADISGQVTDHHQLQFGAFYQRHDLEFREIRNLGINDVIVVPSGYQATPWDGALYLQDRIEYDFITIKLGARFDFGRAGGLFFANPRDPTNGTRADDVCNGTVFASQPFTYTDPSGGSHTGFDACTAERIFEGTSTLLDSAARVAQQDDFVESSRRTQFSPRIGVSFPLSERSQVFFNFGRYSQNPLYNNLYTNTGIGTLAGPDEGVCDADAVKVLPGSTTPSTECHPIIAPSTGQSSFIGNPNLLIEKTTSYEVGFATELGRDYALQVTLFNKDQYGLSGVAVGGVDAEGNQVFDPGTTYDNTALPGYSVLLNRDFATVRGVEIAIRKRLSNFWSFNINYAYSQATTNAAPPDREFQSQIEEGDPAALGEIRSEIDQPHVFNASVIFRVGQEEPTSMAWLNRILSNAAASVTFRAASGLPYTPTLSFTGFGDDQLERNSGRAPGTAVLDAQLSKDFALSGVRMGAFVRATNLLNSQGCVQVFATTGRCDVGSIDQSRARQGNTVGENSPTTFYDRPQFFQAGRSILAGARVSF